MIPESIRNLIIDTLFLVLFLVFSAFFSGTETAFFSMNRLEQESFKNKARKGLGGYARGLIGNQEKLLVTILMGNMVVNIFATDFFASTVAGELTLLLDLEISEIVIIIIMTFLILVFGEMTPKNLAVRHPLGFANFAVAPLYFTEKLFNPFIYFLNKLRHQILTGLHETIDKEEDKTTDLIALTARIGYGEKMLNRFELDIFESYIQFRNKTAYDVMTPRTELDGVDIHATISELITLAGSGTLKSLPFIYVYDKDMDHLSGYVDVKDLVPYKYGLLSAEELTPVLKPFHTVPETKKLRNLIGELREKDRELVHVVDEYGGTAGILSFQHLIQEVLDYFYMSEEEDIRPLEKGSWFLAGDTDVERIEDLLDMEIETESRTVSGLVMEKLGEIPEKGRKVEISGLEFTVIRVGGNRILALTMKVVES